MSSPQDPAFDQAKALFLDGLACLESGRASDAQARFLSSLELLPGRISTLVNLAEAQRRLGRLADALATADQVLAAEPDNRDGWYHRAMALLDMNRHSEALRAFQRLLQIDPGLVSAWTLLGDLLREEGRPQEARHAYQQAADRGADPELHAYFLAALDKQQALPSGAPRTYVEGLFDSYADDFDRHVVQVLHYRAPQVLVRPLAGRKFASALDLGCGTGLCGPLLKERAQRVTGVDLSSGMLDKAAALGVYDELVHADVSSYLANCTAPHDLVMAADVFIYVGELERVFIEVRRFMPPGGVFCFSAELASDASESVQLQASLRYAHSEAYLRGLAQRHGFDVTDFEQAPIREEQRQPIDGLFVHLERRAG